MLNLIKSILNKYQFPNECIDVLSDAFLTLEKENNVDKLQEIASLYKVDSEPSYEELSNAVNGLSKETKIHIYTLWLLVFLLMLDTFHKRYERLSYPEFIFDGAVLDIKYKAKECYLVKGIWGNFVSSWNYAFFQMRLYAFNALQFEPIKADKDYELNGVKLKKGEPLLNVHIPRREKHLDEQEVDNDIKLACEFFKDKIEKPVFHCHSWLLYPRNKEILSPNSHLRHFMDMFTIIGTYEYPNYSEMWRLFDQEIDENNLDLLPNNTSFRRGYINWMKNKEKLGGGIGIYIPNLLEK